MIHPHPGGIEGAQLRRIGKTFDIFKTNLQRIVFRFHHWKRIV